MALTPKGKIALSYIREFFPDKKFTNKELNQVAPEKVASASLTSLANQGFLKKVGDSPAEYILSSDVDELIAAATERTSSQSNRSLIKAAAAKNDEFYTRYEDINAEVMKYRRYFKDKIVYLPCDDPAGKKSKFWTFFVDNFNTFQLKKLIATHYDTEGNAYKIWIDGDTTGDGYVDEGDSKQEDLEGNGDFHSLECTAILQECDIVVTNPPFSLFRDFLAWILAAEKQFLIIGSQNAFTYKEVFPLIRDDKIWMGYNMVKEFYQPDGSIKKFGNICWFTNLPSTKRNEELVLVKKYNSIDYPKYDNYDAIEVSKVANIPIDYDGIMGVPITFLYKYNPNQFEIIGGFNGYKECDYENGLLCGRPTPYIKKGTSEEKIWTGPTINKIPKYYRVLIRRRKK